MNATLDTLPKHSFTEVNFHTEILLNIILIFGSLKFKRHSEANNKFVLLFTNHFSVICHPDVPSGRAENITRTVVI